MNKRIHILGPSGSGTTTLGVNLGARLQIKHLDTDDFYWKKTPVPFTEKVLPEERLKNIEQTMSGMNQWVLSGSLCSWGDPLIRLFTQVIYISLPWEVREQRLLRREQSRFGADSLAPGGKMHENHVDFMEWARRYDSAGMEQRSRTVHERWMGQLPKEIAIIRLDGLLDQETLTNLAVRELEAGAVRRSGRGEYGIDDDL